MNIQLFVPILAFPNYMRQFDEPEETHATVFTKELGGFPIKAFVNNWGMALIGASAVDHPGVIGRMLVWNGGKNTSSPITGYDPVAHRVITKTGEIYQLGKPVPAFKKNYADLYSELGFTN